MSSKINDYVGSFSDDAAVNAYIAGKGWTAQIGWKYLNSSSGKLGQWTGSAWEFSSSGWTVVRDMDCSLYDAADWKAAPDAKKTALIGGVPTTDSWWTYGTSSGTVATLGPSGGANGIVLKRSAGATGVHLGVQLRGQDYSLSQESDITYQFLIQIVSLTAGALNSTADGAFCTFGNSNTVFASTQEYIGAAYLSSDGWLHKVTAYNAAPGTDRGQLATPAAQTIRVQGKIKAGVVRMYLMLAPNSSWWDPDSLTYVTAVGFYGAGIEYTGSLFNATADLFFGSVGTAEIRVLKARILQKF